MDAECFRTQGDGVRKNVVGMWSLHCSRYQYSNFNQNLTFLTKFTKSFIKKNMRSNRLETATRKYPRYLGLKYYRVVTKPNFSWWKYFSIKFIFRFIRHSNKKLFSFEKKGLTMVLKAEPSSKIDAYIWSLNLNF